MKASADFKCLRCGACCRWEGPVRIGESEIAGISAFLKISESEFIRDFTVLTHDRHSLSLTESPDGSCFFYDPDIRSCRINPVKPAQCRNFPVRWNFPGWENECAAGKKLKQDS